MIERSRLDRLRAAFSSMHMDGANRLIERLERLESEGLMPPCLYIVAANNGAETDLWLGTLDSSRSVWDSLENLARILDRNPEAKIRGWFNITLGLVSTDIEQYARYLPPQFPIEVHRTMQ